MSIHKRYSDKTKCMDFIIKDENFFDKYMKIWGKVGKLKKFQHKRKLSMFLYTSNIV